MTVADDPNSTGPMRGAPPVGWRAMLARLQPAFVLGAFYLAVEAALRVVLWAAFGTGAGVPGLHLPAMLAAGIVNDAVEALYLLAPFLLYLALIGNDWHSGRANRWLLRVGTLVALFAMFFLCVFEYFFFEEFDARFNIVAVDYLAYPTEVVGDIRSAYPLGTVLLICGAAALLLTPLMMRFMRSSFGTDVARRPRLLALGAIVALVTSAALWYPTSALSFSVNRVENEILQNGTSSFFRAAATSEIDYHAYYETADPADNLRLLADTLAQGGGEFLNLAEGRIDRQFAARPDGLGPLNVVVVAEESLGAEFSRLHGSDRDLMPNFDRRAGEAIWFRNTYASGTRTARGLEAIVASFPPIPTVSILHRPHNEQIANWGAVMKSHGYSASFLYGGYGYFDNMNYFFENNGFEVFDRTALRRPPRFENIWGVSDEDLFDLALEHLSERAATGKPFFAMIMSTSNHKPYTFRAGVPGVPEQGGGRAAGVRYADFALEYFLSQAEKKPWFRDTVFVVVADHGARVYGKAEIPLKTYEIPLIIYSPAHIAPRRVDTLTGQIDIAPTVLGLLGLSYRAPFFGRDILNTPDAEPVAFFSHNHNVAIYRGSELEVYGLNQAAWSLTYDRGSERYTPVATDQALRRLGVAYYQTAYELFVRHAYE